MVWIGFIAGIIFTIIMIILLMSDNGGWMGK